MTLKIGMQFARSLLQDEEWKRISSALSEALDRRERWDAEKRVSVSDFRPEASGNAVEDWEGQSPDGQVEVVALFDREVVVRPAGSCRFGNVVSLVLQGDAERLARDVFVQLTAELDPAFAGLATLPEWRERALDDEGRTVTARPADVQAEPPFLVSCTYLGSYYSVPHETREPQRPTRHGSGVLVDFGSLAAWTSSERSADMARFASQVRRRTA